jgi:hypothetical protein
MTYLEAVRRADLTRPNELEPELKTGWLCALDGTLRREVLLACEGEVPPERRPEDLVPETAELLVPFPDDELYVFYLVMRIDLENGELERYNNDAALFRSALQTWAAARRRSHRPFGAERLRF